MSCEELPEQLALAYEGQSLTVTILCSLEKTIFQVPFTKGAEPVNITMEVDDDGNESWLENGTPTDRANEVGRILEATCS
ncbi:hypothetical protein [Chitinophaga pinensis]|uniref:Uncharacterized protein n=1 Tax=Chitinophaga pinensis (strain ATCC 43595 / DSM 2588 / LMG 13176 / NBRC 15968 / NCIMB 11800 / UQM 2034) TaxID=485918 RepID=A0A979G4R9_CHIPD|nr:hypothetical protein [Chitinophaga pinensis]ACU60706.1 hypothetical protein Cpin_3239 [Chitinophaga pinensis DSM 2588]